MAKILVVSDDEQITVEVYEIPDPMDDDEGIHCARCRACPWNSFLDQGTEHIYEADAINDAQAHLDAHERVSES